MSSEPRTITSLSTKRDLRRIEMEMESDEAVHKSNLFVLEIRQIQHERLLNYEKDETKEIEEDRAKEREKERKREEKKVKKEKKKIEKQKKKLEKEREKEMRKKDGYEPRASFCWIF